jgi:tryptophanyl-tRNA synthetase
MAAQLGLPDNEIDRLLSEAEARLSGNGQADAAVTAVTAVAAPAAKAAGPVARVTAAEEQIAATDKRSDKLSVRVPQLAQKEKVCALFFSSLPVHVFCDDSKSQSQ